VYSSEERAQIYQHASHNVRELLRLSDERLGKRQVAAAQPAEAAADARAATSQAKADLAKRKDEEQVRKSFALAKRVEAERAPADTSPAAKKTLEDAADNADRRAKSAATAVQAAAAGVEVAERRLAAATSRKQAWDAMVAARGSVPKDGKECETASTEATAKACAWRTLSDPKAAEAICLRQDVADVMRKVNAHIDVLEPRNVVARLRAIAEKRADDAKTTGEPKDEKKTGDALPPADYSDLKQVSSHCAGQV